MSAESNSGFHQEGTLGAVFNRHAISFRSGAMRNYYRPNNNAGNMMFSANSSIINNGNPLVTQAGNYSGSLLVDSVPGLKHDAGLAVEWTAEEQSKLEEGLAKFSNEPNIMRYIKIAATLREKTVRDVALRCIWLTRKRRKQEESHLGRKGACRKDKMAESSSKVNLPSSSIPSMGAYSFPVHQMDQGERQICQALSTTAKQLLTQNFQDLNQIDSNLKSMKVDHFNELSDVRFRENIDLLCRARENISNLVTIMREMPGRMSQMPELPVSIDQDLADRILSHRTQTMMFGMPKGIRHKQEPTC
ncbi:hypothetical protein Ancab_029989 [Ancistrocladus abbreviatus]